MANSLFLTFVGKTKQLVLIALTGVLLLGTAGFFLGRTGFENIVIAYGMVAVATSATSTLAAMDALERSGSLFFSRYS
jgi:hypothetical protein